MSYLCPLSLPTPAAQRMLLSLGPILLLSLVSTAASATEDQRRAANPTKPPIHGGGLVLSATPTTEELYRARVFDEPLVPVGEAPTAEENTALAVALIGYAQRSGPDDFSSLTRFLATHPHSCWSASLLTDLGVEYYNTAHYSLALEAWSKAWAQAQETKDVAGKLIGDRAAGELAYMYARLGRMTELEALLKSVKGRVFIGSATEKITGAREALWSMQHRPEVSFRCGPLALLRLKLATDPEHDVTDVIAQSASTQQGFSLTQVAELSRKVGLNYQMAFHETKGALVVPSVVHWKVGHYAALVRQESSRYLLEDPTFGNTVWATREALETEASGYALIPPGPLPSGWRNVDEKEGASVWGKGVTSNSDPKPTGPSDAHTGDNPCKGMAVSSVHLMLVSLSIKDEPVGYSPPVGPPVRFTVRYNQRDAFQPANFAYANFGPKWTCDWISYITDNPQSPSADVNYYIMGGGTRTFTGFNALSQTYAFQQYDQTLLIRTSTNSYEMLWPDGSKLVFSQPDASIGSSRKVFLSQVLDPADNAVTLTYDPNFRLVAITDAIGQVTTVAYGLTNDLYKITQVTDPFGRFATFEYTTLKIPITGTTSTTNILALGKITDVIGLSSQFHYEAMPNTNAVLSNSDFIVSLTTPYGTTSFTKSESHSGALYRALETLYPDGSRDRVEFNQSTNTGILVSDPPASVPVGMTTFNAFLYGRNTFYWSRNACASSYGDYSKAKLFHWLHTADLTSTSGILESRKNALEGRVWYDYVGQGGAYLAGTNNKPTHIGRVLDDGTTQLYTYTYDAFGHVTSMVDPLGRAFSFVYATNGIDLLEVRQTRGGNDQLLFRATYNATHLPLTQTDAAGQTTTFTYNARGQLLTRTNPKGEATTNIYNANGYLIMVDGPLPGTNDVIISTYDSFGRTRTKTDGSGYTLTFDYDGMDRISRVTHPDTTFSQYIYDRLDLAMLQDRAGRQTHFEHDPHGQLTRRTDPLGRTTVYQWCRCGAIKSIVDPLGRTTSWLTDVQGRRIGKQYADGSQVTYSFEATTSRLRQVIDEEQQVTQYAYNRDDTLAFVAYSSGAVPTPGVSFTYDPDYSRVSSMTDGTGTTLYSYNPIGAPPALGAGRLASVDGPLPNDTITYAYDELGRPVHRAIDGVDAVMAYDAAGRLVAATNALGGFVYVYDAGSGRLVSQIISNGQIAERSYAGNLQDQALQRITHRFGPSPISEFLYARDTAANRITNWSQQAGVQPPSIYTFGYDPGDQLLSVTITNSGTLVTSLAYGYDLAANRTSEQVGASIYAATYNALNQVSTSTAPGTFRTNEWDAEDRLVAVNSGTQRVEFSYDGLDRLVCIRTLVNGSEVSQRRLLWCDNEVCEERNAVGNVIKRFFPQGVRIESGQAAGNYYYTRDHLGSVRELTSSTGAVRARYAYDPWGRRTRLEGDLDADFGIAGMFWAAETGLAVTRFRAYDPELGRWLSRDPLDDAELEEGPNLYAYAKDNPVNLLDPLGLKPCCDEEADWAHTVDKDVHERCEDLSKIYELTCRLAFHEHSRRTALAICSKAAKAASNKCDDIFANELRPAEREHEACLNRPCAEPDCALGWDRLPFPHPVGGGKVVEQPRFGPEHQPSSGHLPGSP